MDHQLCFSTSITLLYPLLLPAVDDSKHVHWENTKRNNPMKKLILLVFLPLVLANCTEQLGTDPHETTATTDIQHEGLEGEWKFDERLVGKKINNKILQSTLLAALEGAMEREFVPSFDQFILYKEIRRKIQFFDYPNVQFGDVLFDAYYVNIEFEEEANDMNLVFIVNPTKGTVNNSLILYEQCVNESELKRTVNFRYPYINSIGTWDSDTVINQQYVLQKGNFLRYFATDGKRTKDASLDGIHYTSKGMVKDHLKSGYWEEQCFTSSYTTTNGIKTTKGSYHAGLKEGLWIERYLHEPTGEYISSSGNYQNGKKQGEWKTIFRDSCILSTHFTKNRDLDFPDPQDKPDASRKLYAIQQMGGAYTFQVIGWDEATSKQHVAIPFISINGTTAILQFDPYFRTKSGEYQIDALSNNTIYCSRIIDEYGSTEDFQIKYFEGQYYIKGTVFFIDEWMQIDQAYSL